MKNLVLILILFFSQFAISQTKLIERVYEGEAKVENATLAKREILDKTIENASISLIKDLISDEKFNKNKSLINKIIKNYARYIPFSKIGEVKGSKEAGFSMSVTLKISIDELKSILLEKGLLYDSDGAPIVLAFVGVNDTVNAQTYNWWVDGEQNFIAMKYYKIFESSLKTSLRKYAFFLPQTVDYILVKRIPKSFRTLSLSFEDMQLLGKNFGAQVIVKGSLAVNTHPQRAKTYQIQISLEALQISNGRIVADVVRTFDTPQGPYEQVIEKTLKENSEALGLDFSQQISESWQRGSIGAQLIRVAFKNTLTILDQESLRELLRNQIKEIRTLKDRAISNEEIAFEVESAVGAAELISRIEAVSFKGKKISIQNSNEKELIFKILN